MISEDISVFLKLRPRLSSEQGKESQVCWEVPGPTSILDLLQEKLYLFDRVYSPQSSTQAIYEEVIENLIWRTIEGFNSCVCAFGQSGSGKSYLMQGSENLDFSLIKLTLSTLFAYVSTSLESEYLLRCSLFEISNNLIYDLLSNENKLISDYKELTEEFLISLNQSCNLLALGLANKGSGHITLKITVEHRHITRKDNYRLGNIYLIDISDKHKENKILGVLKTAENKFIEKKSEGFSQVISKYSETESKSPAKNLKISEFLSTVLESNVKVAMICCLSPSFHDYDQSIESLLLSKKAKKIKVKQGKNQIIQSELKMLKLEQEKSTLTDKLNNLEERSVFLMKKGALDTIKFDGPSEEIESLLTEQLSSINQLEKIQKFFLSASNTQKDGPKSADPVTLERRILRYSLSRTSSEFKDDGFLMNIIRANKNAQAFNIFNPRIDLVSELSYNENIKSLDMVNTHKEARALVQEFSHKDSLLIDKIDNLNQLFEGFGPKESLNFEDANLIRESLSYLQGEKEWNAEKMAVLIEEQDKIIDALQFKLLDKDDKLDLLQDELDLCRNNLMNMQKQLKDIKKNK